MHTPRPFAPEPVTVVDLFSGCGGFTQGFHEFRPDGAKGTGPVFHSIAAVEHDASAAATYAANFGSGRWDKTVPPARIHFGDIEKWQPTEDALHADVVVGGPPCQGFSALNRAQKGTERNRLWEDYVRIVAEIRPKVFVIENVDRFLKSDEFQNLLSQVYEEDGLLSEYRLVDPPGHKPTDTNAQKNSRYLLNAADYGALQARRRTIVIGVRRDLDNGRTMTYPVATHTRRRKGGISTSAQPLDGVGLSPSHWRGVDSVFEESSQIPIQGTELPDRKEHIPEVDNIAPGIFTTRDLHFGRNPEVLSRARYKAIPEQGNRKDLRGKWYTVDEQGEIQIFVTPDPPGVRTSVKYLSTESWDNHNTGTGDVMGRLRLGEPSVTIRTEFFKPEKGRYLHPTEPRPITHYEAARIQGFPLPFRWCGSKTDIARQIGNAVPIPLGTAIASAIHAYLRG
ncbi:DNA cytosine methyltransferase [Streptomyces nigrescens]|uniref:Cytosine-specific methyltransferase n=2 Tax=Streptomyces nigrescens TaxID=1920 RepID=A0A640TPD8_STRNI|nr:MULTISPECIES: DNA cytosine methyltransferase [Streptomyces]WAT98515.1 DNA cytosine methyltransferase [Streptomyces libani subsp. libani]WAU06489.1 DNA cytosine methyltransferase [Streptomyces nigrescens]GFE24141.1 DNA (cytosine-5-)-methyltransferase [Streptomyces libani subsp. libani]GGV99994.1 DNA (cytosine-5-)-methyltransferase [Streptomyces libani subsp. libani]